MMLIKRLTIALSIYSLTGCAGVSRPDADVCGINYATDAAAHLTCYNIKNDFNDDGTLKSTAKSHKKLIPTPQSLNAGKYISKEDWPKIQVWLQDLRDYATNNCQ